MNGLGTSAVRLALIFATWAILNSSASAQSLVEDWSVRCAMFRSVLGWMAGHPDEVREPRYTGEFRHPAEDVFFFGGSPLPPGIPTRLGAKPSSGWAFEFGLSLRCQTRKFRKSDVDYVFNTPVIADDYAAVDLLQQTVEGLGETTYSSTTRFVLRREGGQWQVVRAMTFESARFHIEV